jgi:transcriptional regulator with XRE-family HTH domain
MARVARPKPKGLPKKLLQIRHALNLSQGGMLYRLRLHERLSRNAVSAYELGRSEPPLPVLLDYARIANVWMDVLVDDELDLPERIPSPAKSEGIRRKSSQRSKSNR